MYENKSRQNLYIVLPCSGMASFNNAGLEKLTVNSVSLIVLYIALAWVLNRGLSSKQYMLELKSFLAIAIKRISGGYESSS